MKSSENGSFCGQPAAAVPGPVSLLVHLCDTRGGTGGRGAPGRAGACGARPPERLLRPQRPAARQDARHLDRLRQVPPQRVRGAHLRAGRAASPGAPPRRAAPPALSFQGSFQGQRAPAHCRRPGWREPAGPAGPAGAGLQQISPQRARRRHLPTLAAHPPCGRGARAPQPLPCAARELRTRAHTGRPARRQRLPPSFAQGRVCLGAGGHQRGGCRPEERGVCCGLQAAAPACTTASTGTRGTRACASASPSTSASCGPAGSPAALPRGPPPGRRWGPRRALPARHAPHRTTGGRTGPPAGRTGELYLERRLEQPEGQQQRAHLRVPAPQHAARREPVRLLPALERALRLREADLEGHHARGHRSVAERACRSSRLRRMSQSLGLGPRGPAPEACEFPRAPCSSAS